MKLASSLLALTLIAATSAKAEPVDLELILAVDVSRSIDPAEAKLQRDGYIAALRDPRVHAAIKSGFNRRIAVLYLEWAGYGNTKIVVNWMPIANLEDANRFIAQLTAIDPFSASRTSISGAIEAAVPLFDNNGYESERRVIDVSGRPATPGPMAPVARDAALKKGITINGLAILDDQPSFGGPPVANLDLYYESCVIGGTGAFVIAAESFASFGEAILRKLILEIAEAQHPAKPPAKAQPENNPLRHLVAANRTAPACDVGENQWRRMIQ